MDLNYILKLYEELEKYLKKHGNNSIIQSYKIVKKTIDVLKSDENSNIKEQVVIQSYKLIYPGKGGLSEFFIWDNNIEKRKQLNEPLDTIHNELWIIIKEYI